MSRGADQFRRVLVTDRRLLGTEPLPATVAAAADHWKATLIVLREKDLDAGELLAVARELMASTTVPVVVAHRPEVARAAGAAGVHLGWTSPSVQEARAVVGASRLIGVSVHDVEEGVARAAEGADYLFMGPVSSTPKEHPIPPIGLAPVGTLAERVSVPVVGIGGLGPDDLPGLRAAGASGVAAIRAFTL